MGLTQEAKIINTTEETVEKPPNPNPIISLITQASQLFLLFTKKVLTFER